MKINRNFDNLVPSYLFAEIASRTAAYVKAHPDNRLIRMGIGDVTLPLPPIAVEALRRGADELGVKETFKGYPEYEGYDFVREAVAGYYRSFGVTVAADEVFISDGAKSDTGNIGDIFGADNTVLVTDPVYPVYVDANIMAGRKIVYAPCLKENDFLAMPDKSLSPDMIYLCSPNNPTGAAYSAEQLRAWVDYANEHDAVILYDAAYEAFITDGSPRSIFAIEGARTCAIEFCSLSKTAGFTGTRCGYTVIPKELVRDGHSLRDLWYRRQATKFNGVSYPVQCAAAAVFSEEGLRQVHENLAYYQENARVISAALDEMGIYYTGGKNSPYIWLECPNGLGSWEFFDLLLNEAQVVGTPGEGFGAQGEGYLRLTSFNSRENTVEAVQRIKKLLSSSV
ncbi:LL-diaminopimelate aminotransferase [Ruminococcus sp.]|uniref:LL-diaminopimelate aminotransferase n=1 Tax=Ruminococcus sp. TaxID=41978 RepID=UPI00388EA910